MKTKTSSTLMLFLFAAAARAQVGDTCAPAAIVGGDARAEVGAEVDANGTGLVVTMIEGDRTPRRAATPQVAARIIKDAADDAAVALLIPFRPVLPELVQAAEDLAVQRPWLDAPAVPAVGPTADIDLWQSAAFDGALSGPVQIDGFSVRPGGYIRLAAPYLNRPFAFGPAADEIGVDVAGGGARVVLTVPYLTRTLDLSVGAGLARFAYLVPLGANGERLRGPTIGIFHTGIGFDLGR